MRSRSGMAKGVAMAGWLHIPTQKSARHGVWQRCRNRNKRIHEFWEF